MKADVTLDLAFAVWCWIMLVFESKPSVLFAVIAAIGFGIWCLTLWADLQERKT